MSTTKWAPDDAELDRLSRGLPPSEQAHERAEQNRTRVLASAATVAQQSRRSRIPMLAAAGLSLAAAAAFVIWFMDRDSATVAKETIAELRPSQFERGAWPSYRLRLHDGRLSVRVASLDTADRFVLATSDAEVETRGARFVADVALARLAEVVVDEGRIELRVTGQRPVFLSAGERWTATKIAHVEDLDPVKPKVDSQVAAAVPAIAVQTFERTRPAPTGPAGDRSAPKRRGDPTEAISTERTGTQTKIGNEPSPTKPPRASENTGEAEFRRGWTALRTGDPGAATIAFARACDEIKSDPLGEDACYWAGVAAKRAGQAAAARSSLARFLDRFPSSARTGEASALLGWLLYEANDLDGAERRFRRATSDRAPTVRTSAERGLEAIARRHNSP